VPALAARDKGVEGHMAQKRPKIKKGEEVCLRRLLERKPRCRPANRTARKTFLGYPCGVTYVSYPQKEDHHQKTSTGVTASLYRGEGGDAVRAERCKK